MWVATANKVTYKSTYREVLPRLIQPIHDTVTITEVKTDTIVITDTVYIEVGTGNATGVCIQSKQLQGGRFTGSLPSSGLYFIKLTSHNRTYTKRLVVK